MLSKAANDLQAKYKMLKNQKLLLERELEIVDKEKIQSLQTPALDLTSSVQGDERKTAGEVGIVAGLAGSL
jgi:hypothetical protein